MAVDRSYEVHLEVYAAATYLLFLMLVGCRWIVLGTDLILILIVIHGAADDKRGRYIM